jgi:hypothetical protein
LSIPDRVGLPRFGGFATRFKACSISFLNRSLPSGHPWLTVVRIVFNSMPDSSAEERSICGLPFLRTAAKRPYSS